MFILFVHEKGLSMFKKMNKKSDNSKDILCEKTLEIDPPPYCKEKSNIERWKTNIQRISNAYNLDSIEFRQFLDIIVKIMDQETAKGFACVKFLLRVHYGQIEYITWDKGFSKKKCDEQRLPEDFIFWIYEFGMLKLRVFLSKELNLLFHPISPKQIVENGMKYVEFTISV